MITLLVSLAIIADPGPFNVRPTVVVQPAVSQPQSPFCFVTNQATYLALELTRQQIQLADNQTRYVDDHPLLVLQQQRIQALKKVVEKQGKDIEQKYVKALLAKSIAQAESELALGQQELQADHPKLRQLRGQLERLKEIDNAGMGASDETNGERKNKSN